MADRADASRPTVETVSDPRTVLKPYESVTTSRVALKNLDVELCPDTNPTYDIHDRVGFVSTNYTTNNRTTRLENLDTNLSDTPDTSLKVNRYPENQCIQSSTPNTSPLVNGYPELHPNSNFHPNSNLSDISKTSPPVNG